MSDQTDRKFLLVMMFFLLGLGGVGFFYASKLPAYKDEAFYQNQYMSIAVESSIKDASKKFHELRDSQLTNKYKIQDYSLTAFSIGLVLLGVIFLGGRQATAFSSKKKIVFLGIISALMTSSASCSLLLLDFNRGEFPWWADSLSIPVITQEIPFFLFLMIWVFVHFLFLRPKFECGKPIFCLEVLKSNYWITFITLISVLFLLDSIVRGRFMMVMPGCLWVYFYLSLASGRINTSPKREHQPII